MSLLFYNANYFLGNMAAPSDEEAQLLAEGNRTAPINNVATYKRQYYTLPAFRFVNVAKTILFIDAILSLSLWLAGMLL